MKIFIEGTPLFQQRTGVGQYTKRLLDAAIKLDKKNSYTVFSFLFLGKRVKTQPLNAAKNLHYKFVRFLPGRGYNKLVKARVAPPVDVLLGVKPDIMIWPNFVSWPNLFARHNINVIYDLSYIYQSQHSDNANRRYLEAFVPRSIKKASHIITISENSKREIMDYYKLPDEQITIINPAFDAQDYQPQPAAKINAIKTKYKIKGDYILYTGTLEPRKNIAGILSAYSDLPPKLQKQYTLVLAGGKGWLDEGITKHLEALKDLPIITTGYVPDEDLPALYSGASLFVYPSHYEGFGMPPLEAMACNVPVIASNNSSLPEVVGDAGILIGASDITALAQEMQRVLTDDKLADSMRKKGLAQAKKFSWEKSARILLDVIAKVGRDK